MKRIGMRTVKTIIAIIVCYLIYIILMLIDNFAFNKVRTLTNFFVPFLAASSSFMAISKSKKDKNLNIKKLLISTLFIVLLSFFIILIYQFISNSKWPEFISVDPLHLFIPSLLLAIGAFIIVYLMNVFKFKEYTVYSVVIYLIIISIQFYNVTLLIKFLYSIISLFTGILIAYIINNINFRFNKNQSILFIYGLDEGKEKDNNHLDEYVLYSLNDLIEEGCKVTFFTIMEIEGIIKNISNVSLELPVLSNYGSVLYAVNTNTYLKVINIDINISISIKNFLDKTGYTFYTHIIKNNMSYTYVKSLVDIKDLIYSEELKNRVYSNFLIEDYVINDDVNHFKLILNHVDLILFLENIRKEDFYNDICIQSIDFDNEYVIVYIYASEVLNLEYIKEYNVNTIYSYSVSESDRILFDKSNIAITYDNANINVKNHATKIIKSNRRHSLIRDIKKSFYKKNKL